MFCNNCGKMLEDNTKFCSGCGKPVDANMNGAQNNSAPNFNNAAQNNTAPNYASYGAPAPENPLIRLSGKIKVEAIIWIVVASLQILTAIICLFLCNQCLNSYLYKEDGISFGIAAFIYALVAVINYVVASKNFKYRKQILNDPRGIVANFEPIGGRIGNLIYNIIFGGVLGIVGSIYGLCTRSYVMNNAGYFRMIENQASSMFNGNRG